MAARQTSAESSVPVGARAGHVLLQFVGFRLDGTDYALPILSIREIILMRPITRVPQVPDYVDGLINLRGLVIPVVSLRRRFGLPPREHDEETRTIVATIGEKLVGCVVDSVTQVTRIASEQIQPTPPAITSVVRRFVSGLAQLDDRLLVLLDLERLFEGDDLEVHEPNRAGLEDRITRVS
jgi:purine-binding chemotaxis protein CheW